MISLKLTHGWRATAEPLKKWYTYIQRDLSWWMQITINLKYQTNYSIFYFHQPKGRHEGTPAHFWGKILMQTNYGMMHLLEFALRSMEWKIKRPFQMSYFQFSSHNQQLNIFNLKLIQNKDDKIHKSKTLKLKKKRL